MDYGLPQIHQCIERAGGETTDEQVIERVTAGDTEAFGLLVRKYEDFVYTLARGLVASDIAAADIAQETFLRAYRAMRRFEKKAAFKTWLYRIAYNVAMNYLKKAKRSVPPAESDEDGITQSDVSTATRLLLKRLIDMMRPEYRAMIMLHYYDDLKYEEIAEVLNCPLGTVKVRLYRAKIELRALWEKYAI
jgi:RNA polymerase sigma-70 factor (ECF subfamily)